MAEENKRALLPISCGDLGQNSYDIERNLQPLLKLALQVSAIVLIDEADTFLADRGAAKSYIHSAIVSIFLRYLEYFPGVIFLTTNQETEVDDAVSSRAISLHFDPLNATSRTKIWKNHLFKGSSNLTEQAIQTICEEAGKKYELDGRKIKKLAQLSLDASRRRKKEVSVDTIQQMYDLTHSSSCSRAAN
jgi:SpoVK/Ycf46/Vps4 family AAA+-type ATPase